MKKCRHGKNLTLFERIAQFFRCSDAPQDRHVWKQFRKRFDVYWIYTCRECECGAEEILQDGVMGSGKWRDVKAPWAQEWELLQFEAATRDDK